MDVLSEMTFSTSVYAYGANDPIYFNDPSGALAAAFPVAKTEPDNAPSEEGETSSDPSGSGWWMDFGWMFSYSGMGGSYGGSGGGGSGYGGGDTYMHGGGGGSSGHQLIGSTGNLGGEDATPNYNKSPGGIDISRVENLSNTQLLDNMRALFKYYTSGDLVQAGQEFVDRFSKNLPGKYVNLTLNNELKEHSSFLNFEEEVKQRFTDAVKNNNGDVSNLKIALPDLPYFDEKFTGEGIIVHGVQKGDIYLENFTLSADGSFSATLNIQLFDDFGLSVDDVMKNQNKTILGVHVPQLDGLISWWVLQNQRGYNPFVTVMSFFYTFSGKLP